MSRQERREAAKLNRRECPQHGSQYEMAFRETLRIAKKGANPVMV